MGEHDEFLSDFLEECDENLDQLDQELVALEENPRDESRLRSIFRNVHTIKGSSGFFGFAKIGALAHEGESLLGRLRDGELLFDAEIASGLLAMADAIREILVNVEQTGQEGEKDFGVVHSTLSDLLSREGGASLQSDVSESPSGAEKIAAERSAADSSAADSSVVDTDAPLNENVQGVIAKDVAAGLAGDLDDREVEPEIVSSVEGVPERVVASESAAEPSSIRVDVQILDQLMDFAGELVLARNSLSRCSDGLADPRLTSVASRISQITSEIQDRVTRTRMQPIGGIWGKFRRIVRDLAVECGKQVRLELEGEATELDRSLLEAIKDPLTHLLRNSVDHGVETAEDRLRKGKSAEGVVRLAAQHESGQVVIEVMDDGGGIDVDKIRDKAITSGLVSKEQAADAGAREILNYIFEPGFSTAKKISSISGRGVGMDVVRSHVERIGGTVHIESQLDVGTKFTIRLPLTLAIVPALILRVESQVFALPQACLREVLTLADKNQVEWIQEVPVCRLRERLLPLISLDDVLGVTGKSSLSSSGQWKVEGGLSSSQVAVLQIEQLRFGLVVDEVINGQEIVVKPIGKAIRAIGAYSAATILGDGAVALILDVSGIARMAGLSHDLQVRIEDISETRERLTDSESAGQAKSAVHAGNSKAQTFDLTIDAVDDRTLLVSEVDHGREVAIGMVSVDRLEEVSIEGLQVFDSQIVSNYRGSVLRICSLYNAYGESEGKGTSPLIICQHDGTRFGVLVKQINDVIDMSLEQRRDVADGSGVGGTELDGRFVLVRGRVVEVLDLETQYRLTMGDAR